MLYSALIFGLLGSFHCIGMCGPIAFMLPVARNNPLQKLFHIFLYHSGRLFSYGIIGYAFGLVGKGLSLFGFQQQLSIIMGLLMIAVVLLPAGKFEKYNFSKPVLKTIGRIKSSLGEALKRKSPDTFISIGVLNGFLPCGLVYMAAFGAIASGSIYEGSLYMLFFGLGTIPLMTITVYFGGIISGVARKRIQRLIPVFIVLVGMMFVLRGLGLGVPYLSPAPVSEIVSADAACH